MEKPVRPFESLEWYRRAQQGYDEEHPWLSRARSFATVRAHISIFAVGAIVLLVINLLRSPERVWADTAIGVWGLVVVMHAVATGILVLVAQLLAEDDGVRPASEVRWDPMRTWTASPGAPSVSTNGVAETPDVPPALPASPANPAAISPTSADPPAPKPEGPPLAPGWREGDRPTPPPPGERASWKEASDAAWRGRRHLGDHARARNGMEPPEAAREPDDPSKAEPTESDRPTPEQPA